MNVVTIDGPAASGKSSVSRELAKRFGWEWLSTGAFYRGLAYVAEKTQTDLKDEESLSELAGSDIWRVSKALDQTQVFFREQDVTSGIYSESVGSIASQISSLPQVRESLLAAQREMAVGDHWLIAEGRDCGTVIFPDARVKIYLTARSEDRAQRRASEQGLSVEDAVKSQVERDHKDSTRKAAPLQVPEEAKVIDTSHFNLEQVVDQVESFVNERRGDGG